MDYFEKRFNHLRSLSQSAEEAAWSYLLAVNGGGAVAVLAFIGAVQKFRENGNFYFVLAVFVLGLLFVGVAHVHTNREINAALDGWNSDMAAVMAGHLTWEQLLENDRSRTSRNGLLWALGYGSLGLFLLGVVSAAVLFFRMDA